MLEVSCRDDRLESKTDAADDNKEGLRYLAEAPSSGRPLKFKSKSMPSDEDWEAECLNRVLLHGSGNADMRHVVETAMKYLENAKQQPWIPKFRSFRLGNRVADRITRVPHGVSFLESIGLEVLATETDFVMTIPVDMDLDDLHEDLSAYLAEYSD